MPEAQLSVRIPWKIANTPDGWWVGKCDMLKITTQGKTKEQLESRIHEAQEILLTDLVETGEFETFMYVHGWWPSNDSGVKPSSYIKIEEIPAAMDEVDARDLATATC